MCKYQGKNPTGNRIEDDFDDELDMEDSIDFNNNNNNGFPELSLENLDQTAEFLSDAKMKPMHSMAILTFIKRNQVYIYIYIYIVGMDE